MMSEMPSKNDYVFDTIDIGMIAMAQAITPVLVWFLYEDDRPGLSGGFNKMTNDWYYISWYSMWIGHLVCYGVPAALWIPSYFNDGAA